MAWNRFHYMCRAYNQLQLDGRHFEKTLTELNAKNTTDLYGKKIKNNAIALMLLESLSHSSNTSLVKKAAAIYADLSLAQVFQKPSTLNNLTLYVSLLALFFLLMSGIYQTIVSPNFISLFDTFNMQAPSYIHWYMNYWYIPMLIILLLIFCVFIANSAIYDLLMFNRPNFQSMRYQLFLTRTIKTHYENIIEILTFPIVSELDTSKYKTTTISSYLKSIESSGLSISQEMDALLQEQTQQLFSHIEKFVKSLIALLALVIIIAIFIFITSAYAPIFVLGETI